MNVGRAIEKEPETFRKLKRVIIMGGSVYRGFGDLGYAPPFSPLWDPVQVAARKSSHQK